MKRRGQTVTIRLKLDQEDRELRAQLSELRAEVHEQLMDIDRLWSALSAISPKLPLAAATSRPKRTPKASTGPDGTSTS